MKKISLTTAIAALIFCAACTSKTNNQAETSSLKENEVFLLVGTYTGQGSKGIYVYTLNTDSGTVRQNSVTSVDNPSYLAPTADGRFVYAVSESADSAQVSAYQFDASKGTLQLINRQLSRGADPCYVEVDSTGHRVLLTNYSAGSLAYIKTDTLTGALQPAGLIYYKGKSVDHDRQSSPHPHCVRYSPDQQFVFVTDLGTDEIYSYRADATQRYYLMPAPTSKYSLKAGSGPRHFEFHPNGKYFYLINELRGTIVFFEYEASTGHLDYKQTVEADAERAGGSADIHVSPDGKFLYASNRLKNDGVVIFSINQTNGTLTLVGRQATVRHPRNFAITPNGKFLLVAGKDDNKIQVFAVNKETGLLTDTHQDIQVSMPACLKFIGR